MKKALKRMAAAALVTLSVLRGGEGGGTPLRRTPWTDAWLTPTVHRWWA